jgi:hypothetical protein
MARRKKATTRPSRKSGVPKKKRARKKTAITIRRSSGRKEKFDLDRMASTTSRSGVPFLMARDIAKNVSKQIKSEAKGKSSKTVTAGRVRNMVAKELRNRNQQAAAASYVGDTPANTHEGRAKVHPHESPIGSADSDSILHDRSKRLASPA